MQKFCKISPGKRVLRVFFLEKRKALKEKTKIAKADKMMLERKFGIPTDVLRKINLFAKNVNENRRTETDPHIFAVYFEPSAESGEGTISFISGIYAPAPGFEKRIFDINNEISTEHDIEVRCVPCAYEDIALRGFKGEFCLFDYVNSVPEDIIHKVDEFVKAYNGEVEERERVQAVYFGKNDVDEGKRRLFLITNQAFPQKLEDKIKEFDVATLQIWPCSHENAEHPNFKKILDYIKSQ